MPQIIRLSCSWCEAINDVEEALERGKAAYCAACGHRADKMRADCDCRKCRETGRLLTIREQERRRAAEQTD